MICKYVELVVFVGQWGPGQMLAIFIVFETVKASVLVTSIPLLLLSYFLPDSLWDCTGVQQYFNNYVSNEVGNYFISQLVAYALYTCKFFLHRNMYLNSDLRGTEGFSEVINHVEKVLKY